MSGKNKRAPKACLIVNARSEDSRFDLDEALPVLLTQGWKVDVREKHDKGEAAKIAEKAAADGYDPIVCCGGDGTLNEIVGALTGSDVAVGTIPGGTENVWSRQVGIDQRSRVAATQLVSGRRARVDVGRIAVNDKRTQHFLMMAGLGADGAVISRVSRSVKNRLGPLAMGVAAVEALPALNTVRVQLEMDGVRWDGEISELVVGNIRDYGGFTRVTTEAYVDDGLLDIGIFTTAGMLPAVRELASLVIRKRPSDTSSEVYRAASVLVCAGSPLPVQIDGSDLVQKDGDGGPVEYRFTVVPSGLTVILPLTYDGEIFQHGLDAAEPAPKGKKKKRTPGKG